MKIVSLTRVYHLPALHTLSSPYLTEAQVEKVFGPCSRLHGHDYRIEVTLGGSCDPRSGLLISRGDFDDRVNRCLIRPFRGRNLSDYFEFTSGEALAIEFYRILSKEFNPPVYLLGIKVHETAKNSFICLSESTG